MKKSHMYPFSVKAVEYDKNDIEYEVVFTDFPEVIGVGDTVEDAIKEGYDNLDAYLKYCEEKSIEIPNPSKSLPLEDYSGKITVRMPKSLHRDLSEYANIDSMSINSLVIDAVRFYLSHESLKNIEENTKKVISSCFQSVKN